MAYRHFRARFSLVQAYRRHRSKLSLILAMVLCMSTLLMSVRVAASSPTSTPGSKSSPAETPKSSDPNNPATRVPISVNFEPPIPHNFSARLGQKLSVRAFVKRASDGHPLANVPVKLYIDNRLLLSAVTDHNGQANLLLPAVRTDIGAGSHSMSLQVEASDKFASGKAESPVLLLPAVDNQ